MEEDMETTTVATIIDPIRTVIVTHLLVIIEMELHPHQLKADGQLGVKMIDQIPDYRPDPLSPSQILCMMVGALTVVATAPNLETLIARLPEEFRPL